MDDKALAGTFLILQYSIFKSFRFRKFERKFPYLLGSKELSKKRTSLHSSLRTVTWSLWLCDKFPKTLSAFPMVLI